MDIAVSIVIERPVEAVFEYVSNYEHDPHWRAGVLEMIQTPPDRPQVGGLARDSSLNALGCQLGIPPNTHLSQHTVYYLQIEYPKSRQHIAQI